MQNILSIKLKYKDFEMNGWKWYDFKNGKHFFSKKEDNKFYRIKALTIDMDNKNIEFFTEHGLGRK